MSNDASFGKMKFYFYVLSLKKSNIETYHIEGGSAGSKKFLYLIFIRDFSELSPLMF